MNPNARARQRLAAAVFAASLAAYLLGSLVARLLGRPALGDLVRMATCLPALAAAAALFADRAVWTIARNTIAQAVRVRAAFVILAVYLVLVPALPFLVKGDGTLRGLLHVVIAYSLIVAGMLLGLLTLAVSTTTLWSELREKQIYALEAKPIRRWHVLLGKLLGIILINAALLAFMGLVTWGSVQFLVLRAERAAARIPSSAAYEKKVAERGLRDAREQVLTARRTVLPDPPPQSDLDDFVGSQLEDRCRRIVRDDRIPPEARTADPATRDALIRQEAIRQLVEDFAKIVNSVPTGYTRRWHFSGLTIPRRHDLNFTVRFKFFSSDRKSEEPDHVRWEFGVPNRTKAYRYDDAFLPDEVHEIQVPADTIDAEGGLEVRFQNREPRRPTLIFSEADCLQVLIPVGGFAGNLARGLAIIFIEVLFIAVLGIFCSTFLGFPVSPIVALSVLVVIFLVGSLKAEFEKGFTFDQNKDSPTAAAAERVTRVVMTGLHAILPPLHKYSPSAQVSSGEEVSPLSLLEAAWSIALAYGGLLMLAGAHVFERREVALAVP